MKSGSKLFTQAVRNFGSIFSFEGNMASGKTSVLEEIKKILPQCIAHEEPVDKWRNLGGQNILDLMYRDTHRWGFLFQSYVQLTMFAIHQDVIDRNCSSEDRGQHATARPNIHILERSIYSARYCFVENFKKNKMMADVEIEVVDEWFRFLTAHNRCPMNMIVYLRTSPECSYKRILQRARPEERVVSLEYVEQLHEQHEDWLLPGVSKNRIHSKSQIVPHMGDKLPKCPVLVVDAALPWKQVIEQLHEVVVPTLLKCQQSSSMGMQTAA